MTEHANERDPLLVDRLAELPVADHGDGFWEDLDRRLAAETEAETETESESGFGPGSGEPARAPVVSPPDLPSTNGSHSGRGGASAHREPMAVGEILSLEPRPRPGAESAGRGRRWFVVAGAGLAAAVALIASLLGLRSLTDGGTESDVIVTDPIGESSGDVDDQSDADGTAVGDDPADGPDRSDAADADDRTPANAGVVDYSQPSTLRELGSGSAIGFSPDGSNVLVLDDHPSGELGAEGARSLTVWAQPVAGGDRWLALPDELHIETGTSETDFAIGTGGDIAWVERCDGQVCGLRSAVLSSDGAIDDVVDLDLSDIDEHVREDEITVTGLALDSEGTLHLAAKGNLMAAYRGTPFIDLAADAPAEEVVVVDRGNGEEVLTWADGVLADRVGPIMDRVEHDPFELVASSSGLVVAVGSDQLVVVHLADRTVEVVGPVTGEPQPIDVAFTADGRVSAVIAEGQLTFETTDDGGDIAGLPLGAVADNGVFAPDGSSYALTVRADGASPTVAVIEFPTVREQAGERTDGSALGDGATEISSFTLPFDCCDERAVNIGLVVAATDGLVIPAGGTFSFNDAVGERTEERGYVPAASIVDGILEPKVGGGAGLYATALFNAALFAGLSFDEYQSHSLYLARFPYGRDATVSWPQPDLVIRNDTGYDITIVNSISRGSNTTLTVSLVAMGEVEAVEVELGEAVATPLGACTQVETRRTTTFADGTTQDDSIIAVYRPAEGQDCDGNSAASSD